MVPALTTFREPPSGTLMVPGSILNSVSVTVTGADAVLVVLEPSSLTTTMMPTAASRNAATAVSEPNTASMLRS